MSRPYRIYAFCAIAFALILSFAKWSRLSFDANSLVCPSPAGPPTLVAPPPPPEPIVITLVLMGESVAHEGSVAIKSAIMHTSRPLHFHLICTQNNIPYLEKKFALFTRPAYDIQVTYYPLTAERVRERGHRAGIGENWNVLTKVFMHELLVDVDKTIFIDTDMIFLVDPLELWNDFKHFEAHTLMSFPTLGPTSHPGQICSCIMLMNLALMRNPSAMLMPSSLLPETEQSSLAAMPFARGISDGIPSPMADETVSFDPYNPFFADQGIFHVIWYYRPTMFRHLSMRWDVSTCRQQLGLSLGHFGEDLEEDMTEEEHIGRQIALGGSGEEHTLMSPGVLHFNCQGDRDDIWLWEDNHNPSAKFGPVITTTLRYKWVWLNRGDGSARVQTRTDSDGRWWDERLAQANAGR
ncbi:uncharacterized protein ARMOST_04754 [Armillaria ostoyae]|uniref:Glycosyltransferase family 8 protein n=1 Tax=Armillaria ostoyae TaxID=47428 RepID=A0A284QYF5_ARMOS|nr:uncharacterized protein ARMOST_04754 [Armillaria ostoyae]